MENEKIFDVLRCFAASIGCAVATIPKEDWHALSETKDGFYGIDPRLNDGKPTMVILDCDSEAKILAHELAHHYLMRHDEPEKNLVLHPDPEEEKRADNVAECILDFARFALRNGLVLTKELSK